MMRRAKLRYSVPCRAVLTLRRLSAYTTTEVTLAAGLEKVQRQTLSLLDNVSITILKSTNNTGHGFRVIIRGRWICAEFTSKDSYFEWRSSVLFLVGGRKIPTVSNAALLCARATVTRESCQFQVIDGLLHRGTDILDCCRICVIMWFYCIWLGVNINVV